MLPQRQSHEHATRHVRNDSLDIGPSRRVTVLATVICFPFAAFFAFLGCWLVAGGVASVPGAIFVGHLEATGIILFLGFISLLVSAVMLSVPIVLIGRRREYESFTELRRRNSRT
jgi:hypothetical protein